MTGELTGRLHERSGARRRSLGRPRGAAARGLPEIALAPAQPPRAARRAARERPVPPLRDRARAPQPRHAPIRPRPRGGARMPVRARLGADQVPDRRRPRGPLIPRARADAAAVAAAIRAAAGRRRTRARHAPAGARGPHRARAAAVLDPRRVARARPGARARTGRRRPRRARPRARVRGGVRRRLPARSDLSDVAQVGDDGHRLAGAGARDRARLDHRRVHRTGRPAGRARGPRNEGGGAADPAAVRRADAALARPQRAHHPGAAAPGPRRAPAHPPAAGGSPPRRRVRREARPRGADRHRPARLDRGARRGCRARRDQRALRSADTRARERRAVRAGAAGSGRCGDRERAAMPAAQRRSVGAGAAVRLLKRRRAGTTARSRSRARTAPSATTRRR